MRNGLVRPVSSALLLLTLSVPHPLLAADLARSEVMPAESGHVLISEFYPCGLSSDEYLTLVSVSSHGINLKGWSVCDGEGAITLIDDFWLYPDQHLVVSANSTSYSRAYGVEPGISLDNATSHSVVTVQGTFRLADSGDSVSLRSATGSTCDEVMYGECSDNLIGWTGPSVPRLRSGQVCKRICAQDGPVDSNSSSDWVQFREYKYGYTEFEPESFWVPAGGLLAYTSPDCSLEVLVSAVERTESTIKACSYEFSSPELTGALLRAMERGVSVSVLVDGNPSGGMADTEIACLSVLSERGAAVFEVRGNVKDDIVQHVGPMHPKYAVFDLREAIVQSENFVSTGIPLDRVYGNRGWGVLAKSTAVAEALANLFDCDSRPTRSDIRSWAEDTRYNASAIMPPQMMSEHTTGILKPLRTARDAQISLYVSPDASPLGPFLEGFLQDSRASFIEQFQTDLYWQSDEPNGMRINPLVEGLLSSLGHGGRCRMLLDSTWFNYDRNSEVLESIQSDISAAGLQGEVRMLDNRSPVTVLHNKGAVLDDHLVLVSSNNWVYSSFARNRELAALIDSEELAQYFREAFDLDWVPDSESPLADAGPDVEVGIGDTATISGERSTDDRFVASWSWDFYGDGVIDATGENAEVMCGTDGRFVVRLVVEDTWGNVGSDEMVVTVVGDARDSDAFKERLSLSAVGWMIPLGAGAIALAYRFLRREKRSQD